MFETDKPKRKNSDEISNARACLQIFGMIVVFPAVTLILCLLTYWFILELTVALRWQ